MRSVNFALIKLTLFIGALLALVLSANCDSPDIPDAPACSGIVYDKILCEKQLQVGDYDGNGIINWHDSYLYDHCRRCPECCVGDIDNSEKLCDNCPGSACQCVQSPNGWMPDYITLGTDEDPRNPLSP